VGRRAFTFCHLVSCTLPARTVCGKGLLSSILCRLACLIVYLVSLDCGVDNCSVIHILLLWNVLGRCCVHYVLCFMFCGLFFLFAFGLCFVLAVVLVGFPCCFLLLSCFCFFKLVALLFFSFFFSFFRNTSRLRSLPTQIQLSLRLRFRVMTWRLVAFAHALSWR